MERLKKIKNPDKRTQDEIEKREKFDDMFNPKKIQERQDALKAAEAEKDRKEQENNLNLRMIKDALVNGGVTL